jgi:hypothetical protein
MISSKTDSLGGVVYPERPTQVCSFELVSIFLSADQRCKLCFLQCRILIYLYHLQI